MGRFTRTYYIGAMRTRVLFTCTCTPICGVLRLCERCLFERPHRSIACWTGPNFFVKIGIEAQVCPSPRPTTVNRNDIFFFPRDQAPIGSLERGMREPYSKSMCLGNQPLETQCWISPQFPGPYWKLAGWLHQPQKNRYCAPQAPKMF